MYLELQKRLGDHLRAVLKQKYDLQLEAIPLEIPPDLKFGELSTPIAFELARKHNSATCCTISLATCASSLIGAKVVIEPDAKK